MFTKKFMNKYRADKKTVGWSSILIFISLFFPIKDSLVCCPTVILARVKCSQKNSQTSRHHTRIWEGDIRFYYSDLHFFQAKRVLVVIWFVPFQFIFFKLTAVLNTLSQHLKSLHAEEKQVRDPQHASLSFHGWRFQCWQWKKGQQQFSKLIPVSP